MKTLLALSLAHRCFEAVHVARIVAADHGMTPAEAFSDWNGRAIIDALPTVDACDRCPETLREAA